jgi:hypothetical protein
MAVKSCRSEAAEVALAANRPVCRIQVARLVTVLNDAQQHLSDNAAQYALTVRQSKVVHG